MSVELLNMDCMEYMKGLDDNAFGLAVVDPPYGINGSLEIGLGDKRTGKKVTPKWKYKEWDNKTPDQSYFDELFRVSKNQIIWGGNYFNLPPSRCFLVWDKIQRVLMADAELAWTSFDSSVRVFSYARGKMQGFLNPDRFHPCEKPVQLYKWLLTNYAKKGDRILDTHLGSASSAIAAHYLDFDFVGTELDTDYYNKACERFKKETRQIKLF